MSCNLNICNSIGAGGGDGLVTNLFYLQRSLCDHIYCILLSQVSVVTFN